MYKSLLSKGFCGFTNGGLHVHVYLGGSLAVHVQKYLILNE